MHDLIPLADASGAIVPYADEHDAVRAFAEAEKAESTRRCYRFDFEVFSGWCSARGLNPLPADPRTVAWHISAIACDGMSVSSIRRRLAGIAYAHKLAKAPNPCTAEDVKVILAGIRRTLGTAPKRKAAATADRVRAMLDACPTTTIGLRDRALLALGFAGAFRRSELVALRVDDLTECPDGYRVLIRRSKTDQTGEGQEIVIPRGLKIRPLGDLASARFGPLDPVEAVQAWLQAAGISDGILFRAVCRGGRVKPKPLRGHVVALIVKRYALAAGLDPKEFSGLSLRAGFITSAAETGASIFKISEVSRHKSTAVLSGYVRRVDLFKDHAGAAFL
jgi:site-specific recombinase XerD